MRAIIPTLVLGLALGPIAAQEVAVDFQQRCAALAAASEDLAVAGEDGWWLLRAELEHLAVGRFWGEDAERVNRQAPPGRRDPLAAIVDYHGRLQAAGIELLLVPIPAKVVVHPESLDPAFAGSGRLDPQHQAFYAELAEAGLRVLDPTAAMLAAATEAPMYCRSDSHFSPQGCAVVADLIAAAVGEREWRSAGGFTSSPRQIEVRGDLIRERPEVAAETLRVPLITGPDGAKVGDGDESPLLLLADSHGLVFSEGGDMLASGGGLREQLALRLGVAPRVIAKRGSAATPARIDLYRLAKRDPALLERTRIVVWVFSVREFSTGSWSTAVPVVPQG